MAATEAMDETWDDVEKMCHQITRNHQRKHGGDYSELFSDAFEGYIDAYRRYKPEMGVRFSTYAYRCVWCWLIEHRKRRWEWTSRRYPNELDLDLFPQPEKSKLLGQGSFDADTLISLVMKPPKRIRSKMKGESLEAGSRAREALMGWLREMGWCGLRITEAFEEVKELLFPGSPEED